MPAGGQGRGVQAVMFIAQTTARSPGTGRARIDDDQPLRSATLRFGLQLRALGLAQLVSQQGSEAFQRRFARRSVALDFGPQEEVRIPPAAVHAADQRILTRLWHIRIVPPLRAERQRPGGGIRKMSQAGKGHIVYALDVMGGPVRPTTREDYEQRIIRVQRHVFEHLDEPLPLSELAGIACFSPFHFHRLFAAMVGETPADFIRRLRLERAAHLLAAGPASVGEVALATGYDAPEAFSRAFHARYGMPPADYRRHHAAQPASAAEEPVFTATIIRIEGAVMQVKVEKLGPWVVAALRHVGPFEQCGSAWEQLMRSSLVRRQMRWGTLFMGLYYDDPESTPPDQLRMDVCVTVGKGFKGADGIERREIEGGDYAVLRHTGPYSRLAGSYKYLYGEWLPQSGREPQKMIPYAHAKRQRQYH